MHKIAVSRISKPKGIDDEVFEVMRTLGDEINWAWAFPLPYRVLTAPSIGLPMPKAPSKNSVVDEYFSYWATLQHFLTYSLGWSRHDVGLQRWFDIGCPTDDPRLALLDEVWNKDENLLKYLVWSSLRTSHTPFCSWLPPHDTEPFIPVDTDLNQMETELIEQGFSSANSPIGMHLESGDHIDWGFREDYSASIYLKDNAVGEAVYISEQVEGWYYGLDQLVQRLGDSGRTSWHVDVYVKQYGFMGEFKKSSVTKRWFTGRHKYHLWGNLARRF